MPEIAVYVRAGKAPPNGSRRAVMIGLGAAALLPSPARAQAAARYRVRLLFEWSAATHPYEFPIGAHFSDLFGATHDPRYTMFADGTTASSGLELVAENGRGSILMAELAEAKRRKRIGATFTGEGIATVPGEMSAEFTAETLHPLVSFVTMLAPSPDWFTGLGSVDLAPRGVWLDLVEQPLWIWDAGTDSGATFDAEDIDTQPRQSVRLLTSRHALDQTGLLRLGRARIERMG
jgi:hypothetical protein